MGLAELGFSIGDVVTYASDKESTGGVVFMITENCDPVVPAGTRPRNRWSHDPIDEKGKKIPAMRINGYVRLKPLFSFFPTNKGQKPGGKDGTVLLYHVDLKFGHVKKVDLVTLGTKYIDLGNVIRDLAVSHGMVLPSPGTADRAPS